MSFNMRPLGYCDCNAPFYLIEECIYYTCDLCKSGSPIGNCTICYAPVYWINGDVHRVCGCGTAAIGNITYAVATATLNPKALTDIIFPQITSGSSTEPPYLPSSYEMPQPEGSLSHAASRQTDDIEEDNITADIANRMYNHIMRESLDHIKTCTSCKFLAKQDEVCSTMRRLRNNRDRWLIEKITHEDVA